MVLHLLPKKSWHVYNTANVERVRRDEEAERKREEEEEMKMQAEDGERRMLELRRRAGLAIADSPASVPPREAREEGIMPTMPSSATASGVQSKAGYPARFSGNIVQRQHDGGTGGDDRCLTIATSTTSISTRNDQYSGGAGSVIDPQVHASLTGPSGHINLFNPVTPASSGRGGDNRRSAQDRNPEYEAEKAAKEAAAAAYLNPGLGKPAEELRPWYTTLDGIGEKQAAKSERKVDMDKRRDERAKDRSDPMALIRRGVKQVKEVEEARKKSNEMRRKEMATLPALDDIEDFSLEAEIVDGNPVSVSSREKRHSKHNDEGRRKRDRDRSRPHGESHHSHRHHHHRDDHRDSSRSHRRHRRHQDEEVADKHVRRAADPEDGERSRRKRYRSRSRSPSRHRHRSRSRSTSRHRHRSRR